MINPHWLESLMPRMDFHGSKYIRVIDDLLYMYTERVLISSLDRNTVKSNYIINEQRGR